MHDYPHVRELSPTSPRKFFLSPIVTKGFRNVKPIRICLLRLCLGFSGDQRELVCHLEKNIRFQMNIAARIVHASIFQMCIFHYRNGNMPFKTWKWKEKVLKKIFMPLKWRLDSWKRLHFPLRIGIHLSQSEDIIFFLENSYSKRQNFLRIFQHSW